MTKRMTLIRIGLLLAGILMAFAVIKAQDVRYNFVPGTDFSKYHTYKWVSIEGGALPNQIVDAQIKQSIDTQLASKGLSKTTGDTADLYVAYQTAVNQEKQWNAYGHGRWHPLGWIGDGHKFQH